MRSFLNKLEKVGIVCGLAMMLTALPGFADTELVAQGAPIVVSICDSGCAAGTAPNCSGCNAYWWCVLHTCAVGKNCYCFL